MRSGRRDQTSYGLDAVAAWKHVGDERAIIGSQMVFEHALEHGTHVSGRGEVAVLQGGSITGVPFETCLQGPKIVPPDWLDLLHTFDA